jgi:hypothetical protein
MLDKQFANSAPAAQLAKSRKTMNLPKSPICRQLDFQRKFLINLFHVMGFVFANSESVKSKEYQRVLI